MIKYINLHTHSASNQENVLEIVNQYPNSVDESAPFSVGIHPWYINLDDVEKELIIIEQNIQNKNCLAVGECGLDTNREPTIEVQTEIFKKQLALASKYKMPVIIHCAGAFQELVAIKKEMEMEVPMIIHGFRKHAQLAKELLDHRFYLSFGKNLIQNPDYAETFANIPNDRIFLETDSADFKIEAIYKVAAEYKGISIASMHDIIEKNFNRVFAQKL